MCLCLTSDPYLAARSMGCLKDVLCLIVTYVEIRLLLSSNFSGRGLRGDAYVGGPVVVI